MARRREHEAEPTLYDVIDAMQAGFSRVEKKLEEHDERFESLEERFDQMDERFDRLEGRVDAVEGSLQGITNELRQVNRRLFNLEIGVEDIRDIVQNHEERITKLERKK